MQTSKFLKVTNLCVGYGDVQVIKNISLHLNFNESIALFGPNGHGKTTLLRSISGLIKPSKGNIFFCDEEITGLSPKKIVEKGIIHVPQSNVLFPRMTVMEVLKLGAYSKRAWHKFEESLAQVFLIFPWIKKRLNQRCYSLSGGERQMVAIGAGIMGRSKVLLLDEPTLGLSPKSKVDLLNAIINLRKLDIPIILVDQDIELLMKLTDRLYLLEEGNIKLDINKNKMFRHEDILNMYFGKYENKENEK
jgi:branched-chain amino acid transport system ATP-binding protein